MKTITVKEKSIQQFLAENTSDLSILNNHLNSNGPRNEGRFYSNNFINLPHEIYIKNGGQVKVSDVVKFTQKDYTENTRQQIEIESIYIAQEYDDVSIVLKKQENKPETV